VRGSGGQRRAGSSPCPPPASDGRAAARRSGLASAAQHRPDLILLDLQLPDMDGREVFRRLKADPSTARIPCIALSGEADQGEIQAALAAGFAGYLTKPVDFDAFDRALDLIFSGPTAQHIDLPADGTV
jgi:CheY-like chemotaxis protein